MMREGRPSRIRRFGKWIVFALTVLIAGTWCATIGRGIGYQGTRWGCSLCCGFVGFAYEEFQANRSTQGVIDTLVADTCGFSWVPYASERGLRANLGLILPQWSQNVDTPFGRVAPTLRRTTIRVRAPLWLLLVLFVVVTVILWKREQTVDAGRCPQCGYDLTGNVSGRCPECGATIRPRPSRPTS